MITWYNGMFISKRAFILNNVFYIRDRYIYEAFFANKNTRIKGILESNCKIPIKYIISFGNKIKDNNENMKDEIFKFLNLIFPIDNIYILILFLFLIFALKLFLKIFIKKLKKLRSLKK